MNESQQGRVALVTGGARGPTVTIAAPAEAAAPLLLLGVVFVLDAVWSGALAGSGSLLNGIFDEPAHLATCAICLLALTAVSGSAPGAGFVVAALVGATAIDLDHIPGFLGSHTFTEGTSRPYCHSLLMLVLLLAMAAAWRGRTGRTIFLGLAFGVTTHFLRDMGTGDGIPLLWPLADGSARIPYLVYAAVLCGLAAVASRGISRTGARRARSPARRRARGASGR